MYITYLLIVINVVIYFLINSGKLQVEKLAVSYHQVFNRGEYIRIITSAFSHQEIMHLLCNMYSLYSVGITMERVFGKFGMAIVYFGSIIVGKFAALYLNHNNHDDYTLSLGASGAIFGLFGAYFMLVVRYYGLTGLYQLLPSFIAMAITSFMPHVDSKTHICSLAAGMIIGYIVFLFM